MTWLVAGLVFEHENLSLGIVHCSSGAVKLGNLTAT